MTGQGRWIPDQKPVQLAAAGSRCMKRGSDSDRNLPITFHTRAPSRSVYRRATIAEWWRAKRSGLSQQGSLRGGRVSAEEGAGVRHCVFRRRGESGGNIWRDRSPSLVERAVALIMNKALERNSRRNGYM